MSSIDWLTKTAFINIPLQTRDEEIDLFTEKDQK